MNSLPKLFIGIFIAFASAWVGLVVMPFVTLGQLQPELDEDTGQLKPPGFGGLAEQGSKVYAAQGCMYCHSQQIRPEYAGSDIARGWGLRRTVPRDYIGEKPVFLGTMRTGPDLTNIGRRQPSEEWHHQHLYAPQIVSKGSTMPPYKFLYEKRKIVGQRSDDAFEIPGYDLEEGYEIVPTPDAKALVAYLLELNRSYSLEEAPVE